MKIPITKIKDSNTEVPINSELQRIEQIKQEFDACKDQPALCQVEVFDMWEEDK